MTRSDPTERNLTLDLQFQQLFDPQAETPTLAAYEPVAERAAEAESAASIATAPASDAMRGPAALERTESTPGTGEPAAVAEKPSAAKSILAIVFGILAAILLLVMIIVVVAFHPR